MSKKIKPTPLVKSLSKTTMSLKFMRRSQAKKQENEQQKKIAPENMWYAANIIDDENTKKQFYSYMTYSECLGLRKNGHYSFGQFNPFVEKEMIRLDREERGEKGSDSEKSVSDNEMVDRYENLIGTVGKKFKRKKQTNEELLEYSLSNSEQQSSQGARKKRKFMKPHDNNNNK